jgi:hypothetical protein
MALADKSEGETPPQDFDININNKPNIYSPQMPEDIRERLRAFIAQHGSVLAALVAFRQHPEAQ